MRRSSRSAARRSPAFALLHDDARHLTAGSLKVWTALDDLRSRGAQDLTTAIHAIGQTRGWNKNNVSCELSVTDDSMKPGRRCLNCPATDEKLPAIVFESNKVFRQCHTASTDWSVRASLAS